VCLGDKNIFACLFVEEFNAGAKSSKVTVPSAYVFLLHLWKAADADKKLVHLSCYILDGTLLSYNLNKYLPSQLAAATIFIVRRTVGRNN